MSTGGKDYKVISDQVGTPQVIVEAAIGKVVETFNVDEFGVNKSGNRSVFIPFGFAGGLFDPDTGLVRFGARDYDPEVGRWTSKDPILFNGGDTNLYGYTFSDPINFVDPSGHFGIMGVLVGAATGGVVGGVSAALNPRATKADIFAGVVNNAATGAFIGSGAGLGAIFAGSSVIQLTLTGKIDFGKSIVDAGLGIFARVSSAQLVQIYGSANVGVSGAIDFATGLAAVPVEIAIGQIGGSNSNSCKQ
ncbi:RHS repeat-associated core domain-containing protein [Bdellovibrio bacteriovorus]|uniref:RHS repeat-associated core domain-containing protein n=1 Tax=Bdellovibrio bacteriovorus TaxID=959 RepID=UPI003CFEC44D